MKWIVTLQKLMLNMDANFFRPALTKVINHTDELRGCFVQKMGLRHLKSTR